MNLLEKTINVLGFDIFCGDIDQLVKYYLLNKNSTVVNTINPHSFIEQKNDQNFLQALTSSDILIPDGEGIVLAVKLLKNRDIQKISGYDLFQSIMKNLNKHGGTVFFLGSLPETLEQIKLRVEVDFPKINVVTHSPKFKDAFDENDASYYSEMVNNADTDILFVGLTAPKQEKLIFLMRDSLDVQIIAGIGAVFDFYSGAVRRPGQFWIKLKLEWFIRFLGSPRKLWKRNFISLPLFIMLVFKLFLYKFLNNNSSNKKG